MDTSREKKQVPVKCMQVCSYPLVLRGIVNKIMEGQFARISLAKSKG